MAGMISLAASEKVPVTRRSGKAVLMWVRKFLILSGSASTSITFIVHLGCIGEQLPSATAILLFLRRICYILSRKYWNGINILEVQNMDMSAVKKNMETDLDAKIRASFFILMQSCIELKEYDLPYFNEIRNDVLAIAADLPDTPPLTKQYETLVAALKKLYTLKIYFNLSEEWTWSNYLTQMAATGVSKIIAGNTLFLNHLDILAEGDIKKEVDTRLLCEWMSRIPLRMAAVRYYDYLSDAAKALHFSLGTDHLEDFKRLFNPMDYLADADWLRDITVKLDRNWESEEVPDKDQASEENNKINMELIKITAYMSALFDALCAADIVLKARGRGIDLINEAKDLHKEYKTAIANHEADGGFGVRLDNAAMEAIDHTRKPQFESLDSLSADKLEPALLPLFNEWSQVDKLFYETGFDHFTYLTGDLESSDGDTDAFLAALHTYLETVTQPLSGKRKRFLRQQFLNYLPYPYDLETYRGYFLGTYDSLDETNKRLLMYMVAYSKDDTGDE
jgi:hypothetical protein